MTTYRAYADDAYIEKAQLNEIITMMERADHIARHLDHVDSATKEDLADFVNQLNSHVVDTIKELDEKLSHYEDEDDLGHHLSTEDM